MENFGNTCYCNSILQCLYYTENFRTQLIQHNLTKHEPKLIVAGYKPHNFTSKYEQLVQKKLKEQGGKSTSISSPTQDERPKPASRRGSLFGLKFNNNNSSASAVASGNSTSISVVIEDPKRSMASIFHLQRIAKLCRWNKGSKFVSHPSFKNWTFLSLDR